MKPLFKRVFLFGMLLLLLLALPACKRNGTGSESTDSKKPPIAPHVITASQTPMQSVALTPIPADADIIDEAFCADAEPDPIAESIASTYEVPYQQIIDWYCAGSSFDDILLALETSLATHIPPETLLSMRGEKEWEEIWVEIGFTSEL